MFLMQSSCKSREEVQNYSTVKPRYMREIGTPKIGSHITNWQIKDLGLP